MSVSNVVLWQPFALAAAALCSCLASSTAAGTSTYPITSVPFTDVRVTGGPWAQRLETNRRVTIPYDFRQCEQTGRIANFARAGGLESGPFQGMRFNDSDVFKVIEGASYALAIQPDPELERYLDDLIIKIAAAQEGDGYLYTARTIDPANLPKATGPQRWSNLRQSHELYNLGHLYEAAVAHHQATGKRSLLDVAIKSADLVAREFGPHARHDVPGHQQIEIGLVRLYRATGEAKYLDTARFFLDQRGRANGRELGGEYRQDHKPVTEQTEAVGHAVRAVYMYCGMADVAALTGDEHFVKAIDTLWADVVGRKLYLTGGIGARRKGEAFGNPYELPNAEAYCETCAAVANAMWNHRMFLLHGDAKYVDVLERVLHNGLLSGVSLGGDRFFYPNPLASDGHVHRKPWFGVSCCPVNIARFVPSVPGYAYATRGDDSVYVNLYLPSAATLRLGERAVRLTQETRYPWDGKVTIRVEPEQPTDLALNLRIPGWARGEPVPGDLYRYADDADDAGGAVRVAVNGAAVGLDRADGYCRLRRAWQAGDVVSIEFPMPVRRVVAHENVEANRGRIALERGPIVYTLEAVDNGGRVSNLAFAGDDADFSTEHRPDLLGGITTIHGRALAKHRTPSGDVEVVPARFTAIPYYAWDHREPGEMLVWIPTDPSVASARPSPSPLPSPPPGDQRSNASTDAPGRVAE